MNAAIRDTSLQDTYIKPSRVNITPVKMLVAVSILTVIALAFAIAHWRDVLNTDRTLSRSDIRIASVTRGELRREITALGKIVVANSPTLFSTTDGVVTYVVKAGDVVEKGQLLLSIDSPSLKNQLQQEKTTLAKLQSELVQQQVTAKKNVMEAQQELRRAEVAQQTLGRAFDRNKIGLQKQFVSLEKYEEVEDKWLVAKVNTIQAKENLELQHELAKAGIASVSLQLDRQQWVVDDMERRVMELDIQSPVTGMVGSLAFNQKSAVAIHQALITVVDLSLYEAEVDVPEYYAPELLPGMPVSIDLNNQDYTGRLVAISPEIQNGQVKLRMSFTGDMPEHLRQNQRITTNIFLEVHENVLRLPRGAYLDTDNRQSVFRVSGNKAERVAVAVGTVGSEQVEIVNGLAIGDEVIVSDTSSLRNAQVIYLTN